MRHCFLLGLILLGGAVALRASPLAGLWRLEPDRSTDLPAWEALDLDIQVQGQVVTITRKFAAGRRTFEDVAAVDLAKPFTVVPVAWWPDNRHIGAYIGGDKTERLHGEWVDGGRVFRLTVDLVLATQQGSHPVNILSQYTVSTNGRQLTLIELRSTRNRPVTYVFRRIAAAEARSTGAAE
ncbi:MAG: hypothetical protein ACHQ4G_00895 [Opitutales bacterium]